MEDRIPLTHGPRELRALTGRSVGYRPLYNRVLSGDVPAEQVNGRWYLRRAELPQVAAALGMSVGAERVAVAA